MDACNHSTFSKASITSIQSVTGADIAFDDVFAIVSDSASYCMKVYRDVLTVILPKPAQILCLAHIGNIAAPWRLQTQFVGDGQIILVQEAGSQESLLGLFE